MKNKLSFLLLISGIIFIAGCSSSNKIIVNDTNKPSTSTQSAEKKQEMTTTETRQRENYFIRYEPLINGLRTKSIGYYGKVVTTSKDKTPEEFMNSVSEMLNEEYNGEKLNYIIIFTETTDIAVHSTPLMLNVGVFSEKDQTIPNFETYIYENGKYTSDDKTLNIFKK